MTINFKLNDRFNVDQAADAMARTWVGWAPELSDQEIYDQNRGLWLLGRRAHSESIATFSHDGNVVVVVEIEGIEKVPPVPGSGQAAKQAIIGRVLTKDDPRWHKFYDRPVDGHRNPVTYPPAEQDLHPCSCGCGAAISAHRAFVAGHDQRAIHDRIAKQWGSTLGFVQWFDETYGAPGEQE